MTGADLAAEAIRLNRMLNAAPPDDAEVTRLLALMLLTDTRRTAAPARGELVPLAEQDRSRWDAALVAEGVALIEEALRRGRVGEYQLQTSSLTDPVARPCLKHRAECCG